MTIALLPEHSLTTLDRIHCMDALRFLQMLPDNYVNCIVTSPPYWGLRDYGIVGQIGLEDTMQAFIQRMVMLFREARRVLREDGTLWLNLGDSYANDGKWGGSTGGKHVNGLHGNSGIGRQKITTNLKPKDLCGIPWRVALALQDDGWYLRSDIIWHKPNPMPESVTDRPTKSHEYIFLMTKSASYWYDADAIREKNTDGTIKRLQSGPVQSMSDNPKMQCYRKDGRDNGYSEAAGRNKRTVWTVATQPYSEAHFATYPMALIDPCVKAGCPPQVCVECGAPWERVTEKGEPILQSWAPSKRMAHIEAKGKHGSTSVFSTDVIRPNITIGWQPTCQCNAPTRPGIVLDMFMGAGTTALVAIQNNRHYIGSELNPEYVQMARQRIAEFDPFQNVEVIPNIKQLSLFA